VTLKAIIPFRISAGERLGMCLTRNSISSCHNSVGNL
jgi:hypothetical protein